MKKVILSMLFSGVLFAAGNTDVKAFIEDLKAVSSALKTEATPADSSAELMNKIQAINNQAQIQQATKRLNESNPEFSNSNYKKQMEINIKSLSSLTDSIASSVIIMNSGFYEVEGKKFCIVDQYALNSQIQTLTANADKKRNIVLLVHRMNKLLGYKEIDFAQHKTELDSINTKISNMLEQTLSTTNMAINIQQNIQTTNSSVTLQKNMLLTDKIKVLEVNDSWVKIGLL